MVYLCYTWMDGILRVMILFYDSIHYGIFTVMILFHDSIHELIHVRTHNLPWYLNASSPFFAKATIFYQCTSSCSCRIRSLYFFSFTSTIRDYSTPSWTTNLASSESTSGTPNHRTLWTSLPIALSPFQYECYYLYTFF